MKFIPNQTYSKSDIYSILEVPVEKRRGAWDTGYREYDGDIFIFSNIGIPGRTGHDYENHWDGDLLHWEGKRTSHLKQGLIQKMLNPDSTQKNHLFTRTEDRSPFVYEGTVKAWKFFDSSPVKIIWRFEDNPYMQIEESSRMFRENQELYEGAIRKVLINKYERNPEARRRCIAHFGPHCNVCEFDFYVIYGELGSGFIHVHHKIPISALGEGYNIDPEKDLIPICPNCHSMVHKKEPPIPPEKLKEIVDSRK